MSQPHNPRRQYCSSVYYAGKQYIGRIRADVLMTICVHGDHTDAQAAQSNSLTAVVRALPGHMLHEGYWGCFRRLMSSDGRFTADMLAQFFPRTSGDPRV